MSPNQMREAVERFVADHAVGSPTLLAVLVIHKNGDELRTAAIDTTGDNPVFYLNSAPAKTLNLENLQHAAEFLIK
jgi:hypothetical protein